MKQVLIAATISDSFKQTLIDKGYHLVYPDKNTHPEISTASTGIITSNKLNLDKHGLAQLKDLKWIARLGSGMEIIDTKYCDEHGIRYVSSPKGISNSVAEHILGMLLSLRHHILRSHNEIKNGEWIREANRGMELEDQTIGIIGYGHTGRALAHKLSVFTKNILVYDKYRSGFGDQWIQEVSLEEIQEKADIISFHIPLNHETHHYYDEAFLTTMKKPHVLINASRGPVIPTEIILSGLRSGKITGACLDVLEEEKNISSVLKQEENTIQQLFDYPVIITPHIAGYSQNAIEKMSEELFLQLKELL